MLAHYGVTMAGALSVRTDDPRDDISPGYRRLTRSALKKKVLEARDTFTKPPVKPPDSFVGR